MGKGAYFVAGILAAIVLAAAIGFAMLFTGSYSIAASDGHGGAESWLLETAMENGVRAGAAGLEAPEPTPERLQQGRAEFAEYCVHCHGAPGAEPHEWTRGMTPSPPNLADAAGEWNTAELFWIVKHGVKMTGMPGFGTDHDDATLWNIALFVERLPDIGAEEYRAMGGEEEAAEGDGHGDHTH